MDSGGNVRSMDSSGSGGGNRRGKTEKVKEKEEKRGNDAAEAENAAFAEDYISGGSSFSCFYSGGNQCCQK